LIFCDDVDVWGLSTIALLRYPLWCGQLVCSALMCVPDMGFHSLPDRLHWISKMLDTLWRLIPNLKGELCLIGDSWRYRQLLPLNRLASTPRLTPLQLSYLFKVFLGTVACLQHPCLTPHPSTACHPHTSALGVPVPVLRSPECKRELHWYLGWLDEVPQNWLSAAELEDPADL
jgi:hypothetical protein